MHNKNIQEETIMEIDKALGEWEDLAIESINVIIKNKLPS